MSTEDPTQKITAAEARALLPELESSGLPLAEFAGQRNVRPYPLLQRTPSGTTDRFSVTLQ